MRYLMIEFFWLDIDIKYRSNMAVAHSNTAGDGTTAADNYSWCQFFLTKYFMKICMIHGLLILD